MLRRCRQQAVVGQPLEQREHLAEVVVRRGAAARPVEDVESEPDVAGFGDALRDALDVVVQPERFGDDDDCGRRLSSLAGVAS